MNFKATLSSTAVAAAALALVSAREARADRRPYAVTYDYYTMPKGGLELELWNTQSRSRFDGTGVSTLLWRAEVEYGISDRWSIALYQTFGQVAGAPEARSFGYDQTSIEQRYRLGERGQWPVDVTLYFEVGKDFGASTWEVEPKLILGRQFGQFSMAANLVPEVEIKKAGDEIEAELEPAWTLGGSYEVNPTWKVGAESFGAVHLEESEAEAYAGPSVSWAPTEKAWIVGTLAAGLTDESDALTARVIVSLGM